MDESQSIDHAANEVEDEVRRDLLTLLPAFANDVVEVTTGRESHYHVCVWEVDTVMCSVDIFDAQHVFVVNEDLGQNVSFGWPGLVFDEEWSLKLFDDQLLS